MDHSRSRLATRAGSSSSHWRKAPVSAFRPLSVNRLLALSYQIRSRSIGWPLGSLASVDIQPLVERRQPGPTDVAHAGPRVPEEFGGVYHHGGADPSSSGRLGHSDTADSRH